MHILVTAASKHGATAEIADTIADVLSQRGHEVTRESPEKVESLDGIDAVVVGSGVYVMQWMEEAHQFMERFESELATRPVWAFSVGMKGVPKNVPQDPSRIGPVLKRITAREVISLPGRYEPALLNLRERSMMRLAGAVEGDFRDWDRVKSWAASIADQLQ
ncbi:MAG: flavodoxin domain-containing protein [Actinomycetaceae bacterium]|nr:flavodoxin domain-containing protein [Actinomycetaceae bacterium]